MKTTALAALVAILLYACAPASTMKLTSSSFADGKAIPIAFTCDGADHSPTLNVADIPANTQSLAIIMDDPDAPAGTWDHWVLFNIDPGVQTINDRTKGTSGANSWGRTGYGGPCPPSGTHRYYFRLYALDTKLDLPEGATKQQVLDALPGHVVAETTTMGTYQRKDGEHQ